MINESTNSGTGVNPMWLTKSNNLMNCNAINVEYKQMLIEFTYAQLRLTHPLVCQTEIFTCFFVTRKRPFWRYRAKRFTHTLSESILIYSAPRVRNHFRSQRAQMVLRTNQAVMVPREELVCHRLKASLINRATYFSVLLQK